MSSTPQSNGSQSSTQDEHAAGFAPNLLTSLEWRSIDPYSYERYSEMKRRYRLESAAPPLREAQ